MGDVELLREMGLRIHARRKELGLTQEQVAERMDVSIQMISNLELGKKAVRPENLVKICSILNVSADYILRGRNSGEENASLAGRIARLSPERQNVVKLLVDSLLDEST